MRRRSLVILMAAAVLVSSVATWVAVQQIRSPAEAAARTAPPQPSPILVEVEEKILASKVVTRGTAHYGSPRKLTTTQSGLKSGEQVITTLPRQGVVVSAGKVLLTVSGRPVFVFDGAQPAFRDLGPGMSGPDVLQLERGLRKAGFDPGSVDGSYDAATGSAVAALYRKHGYEPLVATAAALAEARPLEAELVAGARAEDGVQLPADEIIFVPRTPVRVDGLPARVGETPEGTVLTVTGSTVVLDGFLPVEQAARVRRGAKVLLDEPALGINASGRVTSVADRPGTNGADSFHVAFRVTVADPPPALVGASVRVTIPIRSTRTPQLTVPVSAVSMGPDGGSRVQKSVDGTTEYVPVQTGMSADGYVSVTPTEGALVEGDLVVIGFESKRRGG